ncbi:MAG: hypothetical protein Q8873_00400 [Bacillota bacterium]|nr:hypothetical protein [Bacillota bacterium]
MGIGTKPFKATVYSPDVKTSQKGKTYTKCKLRTSRKDKEGNWQNEYWNATVFNALQEKDKIQVDEFTLEQRKYESGTEKKTAYDMTVWKMTVLESATPQPGPTYEDTSTSDFSELSDDDLSSGELPF